VPKKDEKEYFEMKLYASVSWIKSRVITKTSGGDVKLVKRRNNKLSQCLRARSYFVFIIEY